MAESPQLFRLGNPALIADAPPPSISTPLGRLVFGLEVGGVARPPAAAFAAGDRSVTVWSGPTRFEVLLTPAPISLPPGMVVAAAWAAVWRAGAIDRSQPVVIACRWANGATWSEVGPETGENLDAQTWTDGRTKVTVGLPDYETATTYRPDGGGFEVDAGLVAEGRGHFVCAWGSGGPDDVSTWFAVDGRTDRFIPAEAEPGDAADGGDMSAFLNAKLARRPPPSFVVRFNDWISVRKN